MMKRWSQWFVLRGSVLAIAFGLAFPVAAIDDAFAQSRRQREGSSRTLMRGNAPGGAGHLMRMARWLELTETQKEQIKLIADQFGSETEALHQQIRDTRREVNQSLFDETFNEAEASEKLAEVGRLQAQLMGYRHQIMQEMKLILTPEQLEKFEQGRQRMENRRYRRMAPPAQ